MANENPVIPVIDLFAGPGGLGEGFSTFEEKKTGWRPFRIALSVEKDKYAYTTLLLRSFFRQFAKNQVPDIYYRVLKDEVTVQDLPIELAKDKNLAAKWKKATTEAVLAELGPNTHKNIRSRIKNALRIDRAPSSPW